MFCLDCKHCFQSRLPHMSWHCKNHTKKCQKRTFVIHLRSNRNNLLHKKTSVLARSLQGGCYCDGTYHDVSRLETSYWSSCYLPSSQILFQRVSKTGTERRCCYYFGWQCIEIVVTCNKEENFKNYAYCKRDRKYGFRSYLLDWR